MGGFRVAAGGVKNLIRLDHVAIGQRGFEHHADFFNLSDIGVKFEIDAALAHFIGQRSANIFIETAQEKLAAVKLRGTCDQAVKDSGELDADITAPNHDH